MNLKTITVAVCIWSWLSIGGYAEENKPDGDLTAADFNRTSGIATGYFVSNAGNDAWDGMAAVHRGGTTGPWKTIDKVNQEMMRLQGETVRFRRGDRFEGTLEVRQTNTRFAAFGVGERPLLSGSRFVSGNWAPVGGRKNVYAVQLPADITDVPMLLRDSKSLSLGRTPNGDPMTEAAYYSFNDRIQTSVYDPELSGAENLAGSEIVLRKNGWKYTGYPVTTVEGTTVNFLNDEIVPKKKGAGFRKAAGYFFQKHLDTLDLDGEWFFDGRVQTLYLYAEVEPLPGSVQYSASPVVVNIEDSEAIVLQGLRIEMAGSAGIQISSSQSVEVRDCEISLSGTHGIAVETSSTRIEANNIDHCLGTGIITAGEGRVVVTRNNLSHIGLLPGRGEVWNGIQLMGGNSEASYNRLTNIGYVGIRHSGGNNLLRRNIIDTYNLMMYDGGAIYTNRAQKGTIIEENMIRNGMANKVGTDSGDPAITPIPPLCNGIQCDLETEDMVIRYNTISFPKSTEGRFSGIHFNYNSKNNLVLGNTILARGTGISTNDRDPFDREPGEQPPSSMSGNRFENNVIVRTNAATGRIKNMGRTVFSLKESEQCDLEFQGLFIDNVCAAPFSGSKVVMEIQFNCNEGRTPSETWFSTVAEWNDAREYAIGNLDAPVVVDPSSVPSDFIQLFSNDSDDPKTFPLPTGDFVDPWGDPVSGSVTVAPWRSIVLFRKS